MLIHGFARPFAFLLLLTATVAAHAATPTVAPIFSDGMVLQRGRPIPVWGTADDGTPVQVTLGDSSAKTLATGGRWMLSLPARPASAEPVRMVISFQGAAPLTLSVADVLVGEVWLCSGQSNMAGIIGKHAPRPLDDMPLVRKWGRGRGPAANGPISWTAAVGDAKGDFSSVAIYFGEGLHQRLDLPVGLIVCAVSGTPIEQWVPRATLLDDPDTRELIAQSTDRDTRLRMQAYGKARRDPETPVPEDPKLERLRALTEPGRLYALHIAPTVPYAIAGVIWYQGEANARDVWNAELYGNYLAMLISGLRTAYQQPDLPFYAVQLPSISPGKDEATERVYQIVREQQLTTVQATPHTGLAVCIDINQGLHPPGKHVVGDRLALLALRQVYDQPDTTPCSGPLLTAVTFAGATATCRFDHAEGGLVLNAQDANLFEIAGADGVYHPATASVDGPSLTLTSPAVPIPTAVRYAFVAHPAAVPLYGATGLPASPFVYP